MIRLSVMTLPLLPMPAIPGLTPEGHQPPACSLTELYAQIRAAGAEALDISSMDFQHGGEAAVLEALQQNQLKCACYLAFIPAPMPTAEGQAEAVRLGREAVDQTVRLGASVLMFVPAGYEAAVDVMSRQELADSFIEVLRPVVEYAGTRGITVVIEDAPHLNFPMTSADDLAYLLEQTPGLRLVYDTGNMLFAGDDPLAFYDRLAAYTAHGHAKDLLRQADGQLAECTHGTGIVDFKTIFAHMNRNGFDGYVTAELSPDFSGSRSVTERVQQALAFLKGVL